MVTANALSPHISIVLSRGDGNRTVEAYRTIVALALATGHEFRHRKQRGDYMIGRIAGLDLHRAEGFLRTVPFVVERCDGFGSRCLVAAGFIDQGLEARQRIVAIMMR